jgi:hypothetical protein
MLSRSLAPQFCHLLMLPPYAITLPPRASAMPFARAEAAAPAADADFRRCRFSFDTLLMPR